MRPVSASDSVVELRERHEALVHGRSVLGIRASHPEAPVDVEEYADCVGIINLPVQAERDVHSERPSCALPLAPRGTHQPQAGADHASRRRATDVLLEGRGKAHVSKAPRAQGDLDTPGITEELDIQRDPAGATHRNAEADPVARVGSWHLGGDIVSQEDQQEGRRDCDSLQGDSPEWGRHAGAGVPAVDGFAIRRSIGTARRRVYGFAAWALTLAACTPPDAPTGLDLELPDAVLGFLAPDTVRHIDLHPGVVYRYLWSPEGPWAVHLVQADVSATCDLELGVLQAEGREGGGNGRETVSGMVGRSAERVLGAVNADFFTPEGTTVGAEVVDGVVRFAAERPTFAWRRGSDPWMGIARIDPEGLHFGWMVDATGGDGATEAVGGFPDLIDGGARVGDLEVAQRPSFAAVRHPRSGVGFDSATGQLWIVVVDGRQMPHSAGMSLPEFASLFEALGADEALNLDGGGSTALVIGDGPVNHPSDATGERAVVNALALFQNPRGCTSG